MDITFSPKPKQMSFVKHFNEKNPPWFAALKQKSAPAWDSVLPLVVALYLCSDDDIQFKHFTEWAVCVLALSMIEAGEQITLDSVTRHIRSQGRYLASVTSLSDNTKMLLGELIRHPQQHFQVTMASAIASLYDFFHPAENAEAA